jgi:hypothetical protein
MLTIFVMPYHQDGSQEQNREPAKSGAQRRNPAPDSESVLGRSPEPQPEQERSAEADDDGPRKDPRSNHSA